MAQGRGRTILKGTLLVTAGVGGVAVGLAALDIYRQRRSSSHTWRTLINHYISIKALKLLGNSSCKSLEIYTQNCAATQNKMLLEQLDKNKDTDYGLDYKFTEIKSREDFVSRHPLTYYDHYASYIEAVAQGKKNVMTSSDVYVLGVTSGTSGQSKLLPTCKDLFTRFFMDGVSIVYSRMLNTYPQTESCQKSMKLFYKPKWRTSPGGVAIGPNSSSPDSSKQTLYLYSTPTEAYQITTEPEALYVHLLFGLADRDLGMIEANFASLVFTAFQFLANNWERLVRDIETGTVATDLNIPDDIRNALNTKLRADPARAEEIKSAFCGGAEGLARRVWPHCNLVLSCDTGSNEIYGDLLKGRECAGLPFYSPIYAASEGLIGINLDPLAKKREYLLAPRAMFFEFIPVAESDQDNPDTLFVDQITVGEDYELVVTNLSGLYRYRFGDVVRISGFHNTAPKIEFLYRQGQLLNVRGEKTSEKLLYETLMTAVKEWGRGDVRDYCCIESALLPTNKSSTPSYVVFVELQDSEKLTQQDEAKFDQLLGEMSYPYQSFRNKGSIDQLQIVQVKPGTFTKFKQFMIDNTDASANQFKVPRVLRKPKAIQFMLNNKQ